MSYVVQLTDPMVQQLYQYVQEQGFTIQKPAHTHFQASKEGVCCTMYLSGKLVVQGKKKEDFISYVIEPYILQQFQRGYEHVAVSLTPRIGSDEAGKGDFFGPLCVAAVYADADTIPYLIQQGIKDSKTLTDSSILKKAHLIEQRCLYAYVILSPEKYNELYKKMGNLNYLLAWAHAACIQKLLAITSCSHVIVDRFAHPSILEKALKAPKLHLEQKTKAEADVVVAAASILARKAFVQGLELLEQKVGYSLPKGASALVIAAGKTIAQKDSSLFNCIAKTHFKTLEQILN